MRQISGRSYFPATAILAVTTLIAAPQQSNPARPAAPSALTQALRDGSAANQRKDYEAAKQTYRKATELDPKSQAAWFGLGWAYQEARDLSNAESAYKTLIALNSRHPSAYNNLGVIYGIMGRRDDAIANYRSQLEVAPRSTYASWNLCRSLAVKGDWPAAEQFAVLAVELAPQDAIRLEFLGKAQVKTGHIDEARQTFERVLALPHEPMVENNIAYALGNAGFDLDKSWRLVSGALEATEHPTCEPEVLTDGDKCTDQLRRLSYMLDTAGWIRYRQGNAKEAESYLRSSAAITPRSETELHLSVLLANTGRLDQAIRVYAHARIHPSYSRLDSEETIRELAKVAGGDERLEALLVQAEVSPIAAQAKAIVLVDGSGKVLDARAVAPAFPGLADVAKSLTLPMLSWPGFSIRSIRSIEFQRDGEQWTPLEFYAGETAPPPPCEKNAPRLPVTTLITQNFVPGEPVGGCSAF